MTLPNPTTPPAPAPEVLDRVVVANALRDLFERLTIGGDPQVTALDKEVFTVTSPDGFAVTVPDPVGTPVTLKVTADVRWKLLDRDGRQVSLSRTAVAEPATLAGPALGLTFLPRLVAAVKGRTGPASYRLVAEVQLRTEDPAAPGVTIRHPESGRAPLPALTVTVPVALAVPTILALSRHRDFRATAKPLGKRGFALLFVGADAEQKWQTVGGLRTALDTLVKTAGALQRKLDTAVATVPALAGLERTAAGVTTLVSALTRLKTLASFPDRQIRVIARDAVSNLNAVETINASPNDAEANNEISALILLGLAGTHYECYRDRGMRKGQGHLGLITDESHVIVIPDLHTDRPESITGGSVGHHGGRSFGDDLSSFQRIRS